MTIQVSDILRDPLGNISANTTIRVIAQDTLGSTLKCLEGKVVTGADGRYSFSLVNGTHTLEINFSETYHLVGVVEVTSATPSPTTLPALLNR